MPIYEYQAIASDKSCDNCRFGFEIFQKISEKTLSTCGVCGNRVKKVISWCHSAVIEESRHYTNVKTKIREYEKSEMWSHAAELADKYSEKTNDKNLKSRALENYKKSRYNSDTIDKHTKLDD